MNDWQHEKGSQLYLYKPTGIWYVRAKKKGKKPLFKPTGEKSKGRAQTKARVMIAEWLGLGGKSVFMSVGDVCDWIIENYSPQRRIGTQQGHAIYFKQIKEHIGEMDVNDVRPDTLNYLISRVKRTRRFSKSGKELRARRTYFDYAKALNLIMRQAYNNRWSSHLVRFENPDVKRSVGRLLSRSEIDALWSVMPETMRDQFVLSFECMMRLREVVCAPWSEINLKTGEWTLPPERVKTGSYTGEGRCFIVSGHALGRLRARHKKRNPRSPWIFPSPGDEQKPIWSIKTAWARAKRLAGIKGRCRWHDLRHTALTWALLGDPGASDEQNKKMIRDPIQVSVYAGVSMRTIQSVYLKKTAAQTKAVAGAISI